MPKREMPFNWMPIYCPYFSLLTHTKQLLLVTFCHTTAGNGASIRTHEWTNGMTDGQTDVEVEIVI